MGNLSGRNMASSSSSPVGFKIKWNTSTAGFTAKIGEKQYEITSFNAGILQADLFTYQGRVFPDGDRFISNYGSFGRNQTMMRIRYKKDGQWVTKKEADYSYFKEKGNGIPGCKFHNNVILYVGKMTGYELDSNFNRVGQPIQLIPNGEPRIAEILFWGAWGVEVWSKKAIEGLGVLDDDTRNLDGFALRYDGAHFSYEARGRSFNAPTLAFKAIGNNSDAEKAYRVKLKAAYDQMEAYLKAHWEGSTVEQEYDDAEEQHFGPPAVAEEPPQPDDDLPF